MRIIHRGKRSVIILVVLGIARQYVSPSMTWLIYWITTYGLQLQGWPEDDGLEARFLKEHYHFYYSKCYYGENAHRMGKRWQVGFGNTSWDIGISDLRVKENGEPKIDIAMSLPTAGMLLVSFLL